jgi:hypothetical protein
MALASSRRAALEQQYSGAACSGRTSTLVISARLSGLAWRSFSAGKSIRVAHLRHVLLASALFM